MNIALVTNLKGRGLANDAQLLGDLLQTQGHEITRIQWDEPLPEQLTVFDLAIFLETVPRDKIGIARDNFYFANPEWVRPEDVRAIERHFSKVFTKTQEGQRILEPIFPGKTFYVGFLASDRYDASIPRKLQFLNIAGNSRVKGTLPVMDAWRWKKNGKPLTAHLTIVANWLTQEEAPENVTVLNNISDEELTHLQNECLFHLQPSATEGWSHVLHESLSVNAMILTTDAPPMNEIESAYRLKSCAKTKFHLADMYEVSPLDIHDAVNDMLDLGRRHMRSLFNPRAEFLAGNENFKKAFGEHLQSFLPAKASHRKPQREGPLRIAFLGNFVPPESTENQLKWALDGLGHDVEPIQENMATIHNLECEAGACDLFLWVKTHGYLRVNDSAMEELLQWLGNNEIPSVAVHLDKFWGIPEREPQIGVHPFWKCAHVFTADGSRQEDFAARGVNHHWMRPAVSEVYCHPGIPRDEFKCDVGFVGARDYHDEVYPFRKWMIEFLENEYGDRFQLITGIRGHQLNDVYASQKVTVGDYIFSGLSNYYSDRAPESAGRHAFLLHPEMEGLCIPFATYRPQDLDSLKTWIDHWLERPEQRKIITRDCATHTRLHDTWRMRVQEILAEVFHAEV